MKTAEWPEFWLLPFCLVWRGVEGKMATWEKQNRGKSCAGRDRCSCSPGGRLLDIFGRLEIGFEGTKVLGPNGARRRRWVLFAALPRRWRLAQRAGPFYANCLSLPESGRVAGHHGLHANAPSAGWPCYSARRTPHSALRPA